MITCEGMVTASLESEAVPRLAHFFLNYEDVDMTLYRWDSS